MLMKGAYGVVVRGRALGGRGGNICHRDHDRRVNWTHDRSGYSHRLVVSNGDVFDHQRLRINTPQRGELSRLEPEALTRNRGGRK